MQQGRHPWSVHQLLIGEFQFSPPSRNSWSDPSLPAPRWSQPTMPTFGVVFDHRKIFVDFVPIGTLGEISDIQDILYSGFPSGFLRDLLRCLSRTSENRATTPKTISQHSQIAHSTSSQAWPITRICSSARKYLASQYAESPAKRTHSSSRPTSSPVFGDYGYPAQHADRNP
jgi:hypothetical protein